MFYGKVWSAAFGPSQDMLLSVTGYRFGGGMKVVIKPRPEYRERYWAIFVNGIYLGRNYWIDATKDLEITLPIGFGSTLASLYVEDVGMWAEFDADDLYFISMQARLDESVTANRPMMEWDNVGKYTLAAPVGDQLTDISITGAKRRLNVEALPDFPCRGRLRYSITNVVGVTFSPTQKSKGSGVCALDVIGGEELVGQTITVALTPPDAEFDGTFVVTGWDSEGNNILYSNPGSDVAEVVTGGTVTLGASGGGTIVRFWNGNTLVAEGVGTEAGPVICAERNGSGLEVTATIGASPDEVIASEAWVDLKWPAYFEIHYSTSALTLPRGAQESVPDIGRELFLWICAQALPAGTYNLGLLAVDDEGNKATAFDVPDESPLTINSVPAGPTIVDVDYFANASFNVVAAGGSSGVITLELDGPSSLIAGMEIVVALTPPNASYDGTHTISSVTGDGQFVTYSFGGVDEAPFPTDGTVEPSSPYLLVEIEPGEAGCTHTFYYSAANEPVNMGNLADGPAPVTVAMDVTTAVLPLDIPDAVDNEPDFDALVAGWNASIGTCNTAFAAGETGFDDAFDTGLAGLQDDLDVYAEALGLNLFRWRDGLAAVGDQIVDHIEAIAGELDAATWASEAGRIYGSFLAYLGMILDSTPARWTLPNGALGGTLLGGLDLGTGSNADEGTGVPFPVAEESLFDVAQPFVKPLVVRIIARAEKGGIEDNQDATAEIELSSAGEVIQPRPNQAFIQALSISGYVLTVTAAIFEDNSAGDAEYIDLYASTGGIVAASPQASGTLQGGGVASLRQVAIQYTVPGNGNYEIAVMARIGTGASAVRSLAYDVRTVNISNDTPAGAGNIRATLVRAKGT